MKISAKTINILKNFTAVNPSIVIKPGNKIKTISTSRTVLASAEVMDTFERPVAIYNLSQFLACLSMFTDPDVEFGDGSAVISDNNNSFVYYYADPSIILTPPDKDLVIPSVDAEFKLEAKDLSNVLKAMSILELPEVAVVGDGETISIQALDTRNSGSNIFKIDVGSTTRVFKAVFKAENLKIANDSYQVIISSKGIAKFTGNEATYFITIEANSSTF